VAYKKLPDKISDEELLKALETAKDDEFSLKLDRKEDEIVSFLRFFNIENGNHPIRKTQIYRLYKLYSKNPIGNIEFQEKLGHYIVPVVKYYKINKTAANLNDKLYEFLEKNTINKDRFKVKSWHTHFNNYIKKYSIKSGSRDNFIWLESFLLYDLYDQWTYEIKKKSPLSEETFNRFCKLYFKEKKTTDKWILWLKIDDSILQHLTMERISAVRTGKYSKHAKTKQTKK